MFGLMTRREHEEILLDLESELVHETKLNDTLQERIRLGEEYRARLEKENATTRAKNRELVHRVDAMHEECDEKISELEALLAGRDKRIRELELMLGSFEAQWSRRNDSLFENRKAREDSREAKAPRLPPLARDDRRREVRA